MLSEQSNGKHRKHSVNVVMNLTSSSVVAMGKELALNVKQLEINEEKGCLEDER